jgi:hypothetical protein
LFYETNRQIWAVAITYTATGLDVGEPHRLFDIGAGSSGWDITRDGQRILVAHGVEERAPGALTILVNWPRVLRD